MASRASSVRLDRASMLGGKAVIKLKEALRRNKDAIDARPMSAIL